MLLQTISFILLFYLSFNVGYVAFFSITALFRRKEKSWKASKNARIAVFVPAYKEDAVVVSSVAQSLNQRYPREYFDVVVVADSLQPQTLRELDKLPAEVVEVSFDRSTKAKALNRAMATIKKTYDIAVVLDADNIMASDVLSKINVAFQNGHRAIQAHRTAKNTAGSIALLDAISEEVNNSIFRKGHVSVGLSSALIGSGMAFDFGLFKTHMREINAVGGFDKELELRLLNERIHIHYLPDAMVFDEKVTSSEVFQKQRTRWLAAQFSFASRSFYGAFVQLITQGKWDYMDKALQFVLLPRLVLLGLLLLLSVGVTWLTGGFFVPALLALYLFSLGLAIPKRFFTARLMRAVVLLPKLMLAMVRAALRYKRARNNFLHTPHQI